MPPWASSLRDVLQLASYAVGITGVTYGLLKYRDEKRKERLAREKEAFAVSNQRYVDYLRLCLQYPDLDAFDLAQADPEVEGSGLDYRKLIAFSALTAMLETAYVFYRGKPTEPLRTQWEAWDRYLRLWGSREEYRRAWPIIRRLFHDEFVGYMDQLAAGIAEPTRAGRPRRRQTDTPPRTNKSSKGNGPGAPPRDRVP